MLKTINFRWKWSRLRPTHSAWSTRRTWATWKVFKKKTAVADQENRTHQDETNDDDERVAHPIATDRFSSLFFLDFRLMFHSPPQLPIRFPRISGFLLSLSLSHLVLANPLYPLALPSFFALVSRFRCAAPRNWNPHRVSSQLLNASRFVCFPGAHQNNPFLLF